MNTINIATTEDKNEILALYRTMLYGLADWNEYYPNVDTISSYTSLGFQTVGNCNLFEKDFICMEMKL